MKLFIWDFHGTLEKGNGGAVIEITNRILETHGFGERLDKKTDHYLSGKKWYEYFAHLLPDQSQKIHLTLQESCFAFQREHPGIVARYLKANDHAIQVLNKVREQLHDQILISNTRSQDLSAFLGITALNGFFPNGKYLTTDSHRSGATVSKKQIAETYLADRNFEKVVIIGDSPQDMIPLPNAVRYLYAHEGREFKECDADYRIRDLREVLREI